MDLEKSSFLDFFSYLLPNQLYHKDKTVSVWIMEQTNPGKYSKVSIKGPSQGLKFGGGGS